MKVMDQRGDYKLLITLFLHINCFRILFSLLCFPFIPSTYCTYYVLVLEYCFPCFVQFYTQHDNIVRCKSKPKVRVFIVLNVSKSTSETPALKTFVLLETCIIYTQIFLQHSISFSGSNQY